MLNVVLMKGEGFIFQIKLKLKSIVYPVMKKWNIKHFKRDIVVRSVLIKDIMK